MRKIYGEEPKAGNLDAEIIVQESCGGRMIIQRDGRVDVIYSKRHNKFLLSVFAKAIYGSFGKTESEISNIVNYKRSAVNIYV